MRSIFFLIALFTSLVSYSQNNFLLGFQEFPTAIMGQASDALGNMYYTGQFKGQLTINGQALANGSGQEDIFWVKTAPGGQVLKHATYGSSNTDGTPIDGLVMGSNQQMYFLVKGFDGLSFDGLPLTGYTSTNGVGYSNGIVRMDTSGRVKWVKRTNLNLLRLFSDKNLVHAVGMLHPNSPVFVGNDQILDSLGKAGLFYLVYDTSGALLGSKVILNKSPGDFIMLQDFKGFSDGSLYMTMRVNGDSSLLVNGSQVSLPNNHGAYHLILKTDTSFTGYRTKILNPANQSILGFGTSALTQCLSSADSVYLVLNLESGAGYSLDGYPVPFQTNSLMVLDSSLTVKRTKALSTSFVASYPASIMKRKIYFRNIIASGNQLYFTGQYTGINEAPMNIVPSRDTLIPVLGTAKLSLDLNGPSKSFVARTDLGVSESRANWYGDHREYEYYNVIPNFLHIINHHRLFFIQSADNNWNPWIIDTSLNILSGSMRRNADRPETPQMVSFFEDGSRIVLAYAQGKTALDTSLIPCNVLRRDLFLAIFNSDGSVRWFNRIPSTLFQPQSRKLVVHDGKAWMLSHLLGTQSDSNFIRVNNQLFDVKVNTSVLVSIDPSGNMVPVNLPHNLYKHGIIMDFSFFSNGDLALLINTQVPLSIPGFPGSIGVFILRVNPLTGAFIAARRLTGVALPVVNSMEVDSHNSVYISGMVPVYPSSPISQIYLHNGNSFIDSVASVNNSSSPLHVFLLKMDWDRIHWLKRSTGGAGASTRSFGELFLVNNRPVILVNSMVNNQPLIWGNRIIHEGAYSGRPTLIGLDTSGNWVRSRYIPVFNRIYSRKGPAGQLYLSGTINSSVQIDTISIGNAGLTDGLGLVLDSNLRAKKSFRFGSVLSEAMFDMDIFQDSIAAFTYTAQTAPQLYSNRQLILDSDVDEDAYITTLNLRTGVITSVPQPLPPGTSIIVAPNPISGHQLGLRIQSTQAVKAVCNIFNVSGGLIGHTEVPVKQGINPYTISLPQTLSSGIYYVTVESHLWRVTRSFRVL
jgi:hypothetical protein